MIKNIARILLNAVLLLALAGATYLVLVLLTMYTWGLWIFVLPPLAAGYVAAVAYGRWRPASPGGTYLVGLAVTIAATGLLCDQLGVAAGAA